MARVALTGSEGFIGTALTDFWRRSRFPLQPLRLDLQGDPDHKVNLTDMRAWPELPDCLAMVHLASKTSVVVEPGKEHEVILHNRDLAFAALQKCISNGIKLLINASSSSVYGNAPTPFAEHYAKTEGGPIGAYGRSKLEAEDVFSRYAESAGVRVVSLRLFNAIGMYQRRNMLPWLIMDSYRTGKLITLYGHRLRAWTSVTDICRVISFIVAHPQIVPVGHTVFNYGNTLPLSQVEMFLMFERFLGGFKVPYVMGEPRSFEMHATKPDMRAFNSVFPVEVRPTPEAVVSAVKDVIYTYVKASGVSI